MPRTLPALRPRDCHCQAYDPSLRYKYNLVSRTGEMVMGANFWRSTWSRRQGFLMCGNGRSFAVRVEPAFEVHFRESNTVRCALNSPLGRGCSHLTSCVLVRCEQVTRTTQGARRARSSCAHVQHWHGLRDCERARRVRRKRSVVLARQHALRRPHSGVQGR